MLMWVQNYDNSIYKFWNEFPKKNNKIKSVCVLPPHFNSPDALTFFSGGCPLFSQHGTAFKLPFFLLVSQKPK